MRGRRVNSSYRGNMRTRPPFRQQNKRIVYRSNIPYNPCYYIQRGLEGLRNPPRGYTYSPPSHPTSTTLPLHPGPAGQYNVEELLMLTMEILAEFRVEHAKRKALIQGFTRSQLATINTIPDSNTSRDSPNTSNSRSSTPPIMLSPSPPRNNSEC